jgi:hypothetical protein
MKKATVTLAIIVLGLVGNQVFKNHRLHRTASAAETQRNDATSIIAKFKCDGRIYCSQMTSCEEAKFFLENCPGVKMDGDRDGVPCEKQWCN